MPVDRTEDVVDLIYEASSREALWNDVPGAIGRRFDARTTSLYIQDPLQSVGRMRAADTVVVDGYEASTIDSYAEYYYALNPFHRRPEFQVPNKLITDELLPAELGPSEREYMEDWVYPQGVRHVVGQMIGDRSEGTLSLVVWRGTDAGSFTASEHRTFRRFSATIDRAIRMADRLRVAETQFQTSIDALELAVLTLGADGRPLAMNAAAEAIVAARDGLELRDGRLRARYAQDQGEFGRFLEALLDTTRFASAERRRIALRRTSGAAMRVEGVAVRQRLNRFRPDPTACAVLILHGTAAERRPSVETLRATWNLTPAEARFALLLIEPLTPAQAALRLGIGYETARSHLKALFGKTGTQRQAELAVRLLSAGS